MLQQGQVRHCDFGRVHAQDGWLRALPRDSQGLISRIFWKEAFFSSLFRPSLELSDTKVCGPYIRARLGTAAHFCEVVVLKLRRRGLLRGISNTTTRAGGS